MIQVEFGEGTYYWLHPGNARIFKERGAAGPWMANARRSPTRYYRLHITSPSLWLQNINNGNHQQLLLTYRLMHTSLVLVTLRADRKVGMHSRQLKKIFFIYFFFNFFFFFFFLKKNIGSKHGNLAFMSHSPVPVFLCPTLD